MRPLFDILQGENGEKDRRPGRGLSSVVLCFSILPALQSPGDGGFIFRAPFISVNLC